jgi:tetratricopeptide (TPR) repeat protein
VRDVSKMNGGIWPYDGYPTPHDVHRLGLNPNGEWFPVDWGGSEFIVTFEPIPGTMALLPPELRARYAELHDRAIGDDAAASVGLLEDLLRQYPDVQFLTNFLHMAYVQAGRTADADALVKRAFKQHPTYLFAMVDYANMLFEQGKLDEGLAVFGGRFDLRAVQPGREVFHISEFVAFVTTSAKCASEMGNVTAVRATAEMLDEIVPEHPTLAAFDGLIIRAAIRSVMNRAANARNRKPSKPRKRKPASEA